MFNLLRDGRDLCWLESQIKTWLEIPFYIRSERSLLGIGIGKLLSGVCMYKHVTHFQKHALSLLALEGFMPTFSTVMS